MKSSTAASSEAFLAGVTQSNAEADSTSHQPDTAPHSGWWVRRSAEQVTDAAGQPVGYRHQLMHGRKVIMSGVGADCGRTFLQQAEFLNTRGELRLSHSNEPTDVAAQDQPDFHTIN